MKAKLVRGTETNVLAVFATRFFIIVVTVAVVVAGTGGRAVG
jgi:hypothetical protein